MSSELLGSVSLLLSWIAIPVLALTVRAGRETSISGHAVSSRRSYITMACLQTVILPLFIAFIWAWVVPVYELSSWFGWSLTLSCLLLLIAAWVPFKGHTATTHEIFAYTAMLLFIPSMIWIVLADSVQNMPIVLVLGWLAITYMTSVFLLFLLTQWSRKYHLYFQIGYLASFHLVVIAMMLLK